MNPNVLNSSGALTDLFNNLKEKSVFGFNSIQEMIDYKKSYQNEIQKIKSEKTKEVILEIETLEKTCENVIQEYETAKKDQIIRTDNEIEQLNKLYNDLNDNLISKIRKYFIKNKLRKYELKYDWYIELPLEKYIKEKTTIVDKILYLRNNQEHEVNKRSHGLIKNIEHTVSVLNDNSSLIYGSIGETKAIELLKQLSEEYYIINDVRKSFNPPIFNRNENDRIFSIQVDHIVVGPTGIFVIETKYWSQKSIENSSLFSPIQQLKRSSYALFVLLNGVIKERKVKVFSNNWGQFKISISSILLMMNSSTDQQF